MKCFDTLFFIFCLNMSNLTAELLVIKWSIWKRAVKWNVPSAPISFVVTFGIECNISAGGIIQGRDKTSYIGNNIVSFLKEKKKSKGKVCQGTISNFWISVKWKTFRNMSSLFERFSYFLCLMKQVYGENVKIIFILYGS